MFTHTVRLMLARDYGIRDIPSELLEWFIRKERARYEHPTLCVDAWCDCNKLHFNLRTLDAPTCAFLVANAWQRGLVSVA